MSYCTKTVPKYYITTIRRGIVITVVQMEAVLEILLASQNMDEKNMERIDAIRESKNDYSVRETKVAFYFLHFKPRKRKMRCPIDLIPLVRRTIN